MNDNPHTTVAEVRVGMLVRRQFRRELEKAKFLGHDVSWHESRRWIESDFTIRSTPSVLRAISEMITRWNAEIEKQDD